MCMRSILVGGGLMSLITMAGCGASGPPAPTRASVRGLVTWENQPITEGSITFVPVGDTKGSPAMARIVDGQYSLNSTSGPPVGTHRVEILGNKQVGMMPAVPPATGEIPKVEQFIPPKYNKSSTLEREIVAGANKFDFELTAK